MFAYTVTYSGGNSGTVQYYSGENLAGITWCSFDH